MTLVELSVTVLILGLILASATASFLATNRATSATDNRIENLGQAQLLIRTATKDLRTATPLNDGAVPAFIRATPWRVEFYGYLNTNSGTATQTAIPKKILLYVDTTTDPKHPRLVEQVWEPTAAWTPAAPVYETVGKLRFVGQYLTNTPASDVPAFEFYNNNSPPALIATDEIDLTFGKQVPAAKLDEIHAIRIRLKVRKVKRPDVEGTTVENRVRLPNVIYNPVSSNT